RPGDSQLARHALREKSREARFRAKNTLRVVEKSREKVGRGERAQWDHRRRAGGALTLADDSRGEGFAAARSMGGSRGGRRHLPRSRRWCRRIGSIAFLGRAAQSFPM